MATAPNLPASTEIQSLATRLTSCVPAWVERATLEAEQFFLPDVPPRQGDVLRAAARAHADALAPSSYHERKDVLRGLRVATVPRNETADEARASFEKLIADLADVPADILRDACQAYINTAGTRFFPKGAGELRTFINPLRNRRARDAWRLRQMAEASDNAFDETTRCRPEDAAAIMAEFGLKRNPLEMFGNSITKERE